MLERKSYKALDHRNDIRDEIADTEAQSPIGTAIKMAILMHDGRDFIGTPVTEFVESMYRDICRQTGTDFTAEIAA